MYGYGDREYYRGWAGHLKEDFHRANETEGVEYMALPAFYNLGILGGTALKLRNQVAQERATRSPKGHTMLNILSIGLNDSAVYNDGSPLTSEEDFIIQIREITDTLTQGGATMLHVGLTSFDEVRTINFRNKGTSYRRDRARHYEEIGFRVSREQGVESIPLFDDSNNEEFIKTMLDKDGLHPNTRGHDWIYEKLKPKVVELWGSQDD